MPASLLTIDFRTTPDIRQHPSGKPRDQFPPEDRPRDGSGKLLTPKQIRARARRRMKRAEPMTEQEMEYLYQKPIDEWDLEELARGRPRNSKGGFSGRKPKWITAQVHEEAMQRYTAAVKTDMRSTTVDALGTIRWIIQNEDVDDKGKPVVPASTKLEASKFLLEHVVGKPTQRLEADVSVKLQSILGAVLINPADVTGGTSDQGFELGHLPGVTMPLAIAADDEIVVEQDDAEYYGPDWDGQS